MSVQSLFKQLAQSILTNTLVASSGRVVNATLGIIVLALISRYLGAASFGQLTALLAIGAIVQILADAGLYLSLTRAVAQQPKQQASLTSHFISLRLALLFIAFSLGFITLYFFPSLRGLTSEYLVLALGLTAQSISQLIMGVYQAHSTVWRATLGDLAGRLAQITGIVILGSAGASLFTMAGFFSLSTLLALFVHLKLLPPSVIIKLTFAGQTWYRLLVKSSPLAVLLILNVIHFRVDTILLTWFTSPQQIGLYGVAYRLIESTLFFPAMFGGLLLPRLAVAIKQKQGDSLQAYVAQGLLAVLWAGLVATLTLLFLSDAVIALIAGQDFASAQVPLRILTLALLPLFVGNVAGFAAVARGRWRALVVLASLTTALNLILNLLLIPRWGIAAAAWTTVVTELIAALGAAYIVSSFVSFRITAPQLLKLSLATLTLTAAYLFTSTLPWYLSLVTGLVVYIATSHLLGILTKQNFSTLLRSPT